MMRRSPWLVAIGLLIAACTSETASTADVGNTGAGEDIGDTADTVAPADSVIAVDEGPNELPDLGPIPDFGKPPEKDEGAGEPELEPGECTCDTAVTIEWLKGASHSSCSTPSAAKYVDICHDSFSKVFETGDIYGVKGCKFEITCP